MVVASLTLGFLVLAKGTSGGENWPGWRGPRGDGTSLDKDVPLRWNVPKGEGLIWKVPLTGSGHASPVIWDERIFIVACNEESKERTLSCLDRATGKTLWEKTVFRGPLESKHALNSFASSTPATDGKLVFVSFLEVDGSLIPAPNVGTPRNITPGKMVVAAYDFDGNQKWLVKPGDFISAHGYCASPVLFENLVIVNGDHDGDSYLVALDKVTGKTAWKLDRQHKIRSYVTPLIREIDGRTQMVLSGSKHILSVNPRDGSKHWVVQGPTEQFVASMVYDGKLLFMAAGFPTYHVMAIRPDGRGDVTETHVAWHETNATCYVPSPVVVNGYLIVPDDRGTVNCFAADTGRAALARATRQPVQHFPRHGRRPRLPDCRRRPHQGHSPRPESGSCRRQFAGGILLLFPAIAHDRLYIRGEKHLFCLGK